MSPWSEGYVTDITYTYGYYAELNPMRARWALARAGFRAPEVTNACELGYGQGLSINLHAAANEVYWCGTDFNPCQAAFAQGLARASGAKSLLSDEAFEAFCARTDLPDFDYIGLHGIWSWISDRNRRVIADFLRRKLRVGGVAYLSYNTLPGWAAFAPMRELLLAHYERMSAPGMAVGKRIDAALAFGQKVMQLQPRAAAALPSMAGRLEKVRTQSRAYLAHEYFNADWAPMYFSDMAAWLADCKLSYACSAHLPDHADGLNLSDEHVGLLNSIDDVNLRELTRDMLVNQQFRRDLWVKGPVRMRPAERAAILRQQQVLLVVPRGDVKLKITGSRGEADMSAPIYPALLDVLAEAPLRFHTVGAVEKILSQKLSFSAGHFIEALTLLLGTGQVQLVANPSPSPDTVQNSQRLNQAIATMAHDGGDVRYLSSPVLGAAVEVNRFEQMFLSECWRGESRPQAWAEAAWSKLSAAGERLVGSDGQALTAPEDNLKVLMQRAQTFADIRLPVLKAAGVVA
jgi:SAM-dependent methyltransferase